MNDNSAVRESTIVATGADGGVRMAARVTLLRDADDADRRLIARVMEIMLLRGVRAAEAYRLARIEAGEIGAAGI